MVTYPDLSSLSNDSSIAGLLQVPSANYVYFWVWILAGIWTIIVSTIYFSERSKIGTGKILSAMAVASMVIIMLSVIGSILGIITVDIMVRILVLSCVIIGIWWISVK